MGRNRGLPHYRRIANELLAALSSTSLDTDRGAIGQLRLPSERALMRKYGVARNTARRALNELRRRGVARRLQGSGSFLAPRLPRRVFAFVYLSELPEMARLHDWLGHLLAQESLHLTILDIGLQGERVDALFNPEEVAKAQAVVFTSPTHPLGLAAATAARRQLPASMPLLCMADPLGLSLRGRYAIDLVHVDFAQACRDLVDHMASHGRPHPVLVRRSDTVAYSLDQGYHGFIAALLERGEPDPMAHVLHWNPERPQTLRQFLASGSRHPWRPDAFILEYPYQREFRAACAAAGSPIPPDTLVPAFGHPSGSYRMPRDTREMAHVCADLLLSRLRRPNRPNLHVTIPLPVRFGVRSGISPRPR